MKNLFDPSLVEDVKQRIMRLRPDSERQWGKMTVALVLAHCTSGLQMAMGVINPRRASFPGNVIGLLIKPLVFGNDKPMRRNSPSAPELFTADPHSANSSANGTSSSKLSIDLSPGAKLAALDTHILSLDRSDHISGRFSCTNTSTITCYSSASNKSPSPRHGTRAPSREVGFSAR
jgi:hypothetical protein